MSERPKCNLCDREYHYSPDEKKLCYRHYVEQYRPITFVFHRNVPQWAIDAVQSETVQERLASDWGLEMRHVTVHFFHRSEVESVKWKLDWELQHHLNDTKPDALRKPYSFRGWCRFWKGEIVILVDDTETPESVQWILGHELGHFAVGHTPILDRMFDQEDRGKGLEGYNWADDSAHEAHAEEQFVNRVGAMYAGGNYDRHWWRARVNAKLAAAKES